jgi:two-component system, NarL family, nitrate/nitrite response regulator NarL
MSEILALHPSFCSTTVPESSAGAAQMRVLLAEPAEVSRLGVHRMLECAAPDAVVTSVSSWWAASQMVLRESLSMLLISSDLEGTPDGEVAKALRSAGTAVVLLVRALDRGRLRSFLRLPITAVMREQDLSIGMLEGVLAALARGALSMPGDITRQLLALAVGPAADGLGRPPTLTAREEEALRGMADGMTNRQIARRLHITEHGAKRHVANILAKLNCNNRTMAVTNAIRLGLLPEPSGLPVEA